jgi:hypothetical protein
VDFVPNDENVMIGLDNANTNTPESQVDEAHTTLPYTIRKADPRKLSANVIVNASFIFDERCKGCW